VLTVLLPLACVGAEPPWPGTYKLRPTEKEKLTPADFPGPDGIVYPDWTYAGVPGGIPNVSVVAKIEDFGGRADDDRDDADALERGAEEVGKRGGGALLLGAGTYHLNRPVMITRDGVVLRGAGAGRTKLIFRYDVSPNGVAFFQPKPNATVTRDTWIELHCQPKDLVGIEIRVGDQVIAEIKKHAHWGATFSLRTTGVAIAGKRLLGRQTLTGIAEYRDGSKRTTQIEVTVSDKRTGVEARLPRDIAAIMFVGGYGDHQQWPLAQDGKRGDTVLALKDASGLRAGDRVTLRAPRSGLWMGGMNENWLILFNRFLVGGGPGLFAKTASFDHIIRGNVICLASDKEPALHLATADCIGVEFTDNVIHGGSAQYIRSPVALALDQRNRRETAANFNHPPPRPKPVVPSIFEWQRQQKARAR